MEDVLLKALSFILAIVLGVLLKKWKLARASDAKTVSNIVFCVTLPAALIVGFQNFALDPSLLSVALIGLLGNAVMLLGGFLLSCKRDGKTQAFMMLNTAGFNTGCFTLPYLQSFIGPLGVVVASIFDIGNSVMCTGANYAIASLRAQAGERGTLGGFLKKIFTSVPFVTYLVMLLLLLLHISLPAPVYSVLSIFANANPFLAMFMVGLMFELKMDKSDLSTLLKVFLLRYGLCTLMALGVLYLLPLPEQVRQITVVTLYSPVSVLAPVFTAKCGANERLAGTVNSLSIPISLAIITTLLYVWRLT